MGTLPARRLGRHLGGPGTTSCRKSVVRDTIVTAHLTGEFQKFLKGLPFGWKNVPCYSVRLKRAWSTTLLVGWRYLNHASVGVCTVL